jgi:hypothetical protein
MDAKAPAAAAPPAAAAAPAAAAPKPTPAAAPAAKTFSNTTSTATAKPPRPPRDAFIFQKQNGKVLVKEPGSLEFPGPNLARSFGSVAAPADALFLFSGFPGLQQFCIMNCEDCDIYVCETTACVTVDK